MLIIDNLDQENKIYRDDPIVNSSDFLRSLPPKVFKAITRTFFGEFEQYEMQTKDDQRDWNPEGLDGITVSFYSGGSNTETFWLYDHYISKYSLNRQIVDFDDPYIDRYVANIKDVLQSEAEKGNIDENAPQQYEASGSRWNARMANLGRQALGASLAADEKSKNEACKRINEKAAQLKNFKKKDYFEEHGFSERFDNSTQPGEAHVIDLNFQT